MKKDHTTWFMRTIGILFLLIAVISILCYNFCLPIHNVPIAKPSKIHYFPKGMI